MPAAALETSASREFKRGTPCKLTSNNPKGNLRVAAFIALQGHKDKTRERQPDVLSFAATGYIPGERREERGERTQRTAGKAEGRVEKRLSATSPKSSAEEIYQ